MMVPMRFCIGEKSAEVQHAYLEHCMTSCDLDRQECQNQVHNTPVTFTNKIHMVLTPLADVCGILSPAGGVRECRGRLNRCS